MPNKPLPDPKGPHGYRPAQIREICEDRGIDMDAFDEAFGANTVGMEADGTLNFYPCDVERALWLLGDSEGVYHEWD